MAMDRHRRVPVASEKGKKWSNSAWIIRVILSQARIFSRFLKPFSSLKPISEVFIPSNSSNVAGMCKTALQNQTVYQVFVVVYKFQR